MKIFITMTFNESKNKAEVEHLSSLVKSSGFEDFCFIRDIENYQKVFSNSKDLMVSAKNEINNCDALLIDMTKKPTGRAIEAGIAFAKNKKIIVIMQKGTNIKDTVKGIADLIIEYDKLEDIVKPLNSYLKKI